MTVLDAYALVAALTGEAAAPEVEAILRSDEPSHVSAVNLAEVHDQLVRVRARDEDDVVVALELLAVGGLETVPADARLARRAGEWRAAHYHRERCAVSLADCFAAATADRLGEALATSDPHLAAMARALGIEIVALADSTGTRP